MERGKRWVAKLRVGGGAAASGEAAVLWKSNTREKLRGKGGGGRVRLGMINTSVLYVQGDNDSVDLPKGGGLTRAYGEK